MDNDSLKERSQRSAAYIDDNDAINTIVRTMKEMCQRLIARGEFDRTVAGIIMELPGTDGKYRVALMSAEYNVKNGTNQVFKKGDSVWVTLPCNSFKNMFISAKR